MTQFRAVKNKEENLITVESLSVVVNIAKTKPDQLVITITSLADLEPEQINIGKRVIQLVVEDPDFETVISKKREK